jgi:hypothetical protein
MIRRSANALLLLILLLPSEDEDTHHQLQQMPCFVIWIMSATRVRPRMHMNVNNASIHSSW